MSEAWRGLDKMGMPGRVATGAAITIRLNEDRVKQVALLVNWTVNPRLEVRQNVRARRGFHHET